MACNSNTLIVVHSHDRICYIFSSFFLFSKKLPIVVVRDVCPSSVRPTVCPSVHPSVRLCQ